MPARPRADDLLALDEALDRLPRLDERQARVVELPLLRRADQAETATVLGVSEATVHRDWRRPAPGSPAS